MDRTGSSNRLAMHVLARVTYKSILNPDLRGKHGIFRGDLVDYSSVHVQVRDMQM